MTLHNDAQNADAQNNDITVSKTQHSALTTLSMMLLVIILSYIMLLNALFYCCAECHNAECLPNC